MGKSSVKLRRIIDKIIIKRLEKYDGNRARTARDLGMSDKSLRDNIKRLRDEGYEIKGNRGGRPSNED